MFSGEGGNFDWESTGLGSDVYATFSFYSFSLKKLEINADDVTMVYPSKLSQEVKGIFEYKYVPHKGNPKYPRFMSYTNDIEINDFPDHIDYSGGFALNGARIFSSCVSGAPTKITVAHEGQTTFKALGKHFEFNDSTFFSETAKVVVYFGTDSITHPGVQLNYNDASKEFAVRKDLTSYKKTPFSNSYHLYDMDIDQVKWTFGDSCMYMRVVGAKDEVPAYFESEGMFSETNYIHLKGLLPFNPLQLLIVYSEKKNKQEMIIEDVARYFRQDPAQMKSAVGSLERKGYVTYNKVRATVRVTAKGKHYFAARKGEEDYDVISITSVAPTTYNGTLDMETYDLTVDGVDIVVLSDSNDVVFYPDERKIVLKQNRDILFDGTVKTNNYVFNGTEFRFVYDSFKLNLPHIDSIEFSIEVTDSVTGEVTKDKIDNKLSYSEGTLTIDKPDNKSGLLKNPLYPHFNANHGASVVFNKSDILGGAYDTSFRYQIPPFAVDSLSGDIESTVSFDGEFYSGGVFPTIKQELEIQKDNGFGFTHEAPEEGYPIYGGLATFYGTITLGKNGLRGDGKIVYLNTTLESMDFVFFKDSVKGLGDVATTVSGTHPQAEPGITFPECVVKDFEMNWYPSQDSMNIMNYENAFEIYHDEVELMGQLWITPGGIIGKGVAETHGSLIISKEILFRERTIDAKKAQFEILSDVVGKPALKSDYVEVIADLDEQKVDFKPVSTLYASNDFPYLKYRTSLTEGHWDVNTGVIELVIPEGVAEEDAYFYSTKASQDSVAFHAKKGYYVIDSLSLIVEGIEFIEIADAKIFPDSSKLTIHENAEIQTLKNAKIVMDTLNEYHTLIGDIDIISKKDFEGSANYQFVTFQGDTVPIVFSEFTLEAVLEDNGNYEYHTVSTGTLQKSDSLLISPKMYYTGDVIMYAHRKVLSLDGAIFLDLEGRTNTPWLTYNKTENVEEVKIDLEIQNMIEVQELLFGLGYNRRYGHYSTFLEKATKDTDQKVFNTTGYLIYDDKAEEFVVFDKEREDSSLYGGNFLRYSEKEQKCYYRGRFDLINPEPELPHHYSLDFGGEGEHSIADTVTNVDGLALLNYDVPEQVIKLFGTKISKIARYYGAESVPLKRTDTLYERIGSLVSSKTLNKYKSQSESSSALLNPGSSIKEFMSGIVFYDLDLKWNKKRKCWYTDKPIGILSIGGIEINSYLKGYFQIKKTEEEDKIDFYIEGGPGLWYYFSYGDNGLYISSSDTELMSFVVSKNNEAKNLPKGLYFWGEGSGNDHRKFIKSYVKNNLGGQDIVIPGITSSNTFDFDDDEEEEEEEDSFVDEFEDEFEQQEEQEENIEDDSSEDTEEESEETESNEEESDQGAGDNQSIEEEEQTNTEQGE